MQRSTTVSVIGMGDEYGGLFANWVAVLWQRLSTTDFLVEVGYDNRRLFVYQAADNYDACFCVVLHPHLHARTCHSTLDGGTPLISRFDHTYEVGQKRNSICRLVGLPPRVIPQASG